ncbi:VC0807 family protein [Pelagicoccus albus]|uniref:MFS transporter n=1 Tax=Pelagicoccus albus TaxID=415222 RepID=A0A7X1B8L3_9BACT|nr:VC0807 family protein [Pelagicoccus albus]MBC2606375.1 MFS transporter [Pelagicoccus albus]
MSDAPLPNKKPENFLVNIACNLALPILVLKYLSGEDRLGPVYGLVAALAFPVGYFFWDLAQRKNYNIISIFGFLNILLTGGIGLMEAEPKWVVLKETAMPLMIGILVLATANRKNSLLKTFLFNDQIFDVEKIQGHIDTPEKEVALASQFKVANWLLVASFLVSALLNFVLASYIVKSPGGTETFNQEIATLTWVSWLVITGPTMAILIFALWRLVKGLKTLTGLEFEGLLHEQHTQGK